MGDAYNREIGFCEVMLFYPVNTNQGDALAKAQAIKNQFARGTAMTQAGQVIKVDRTPTIGKSITMNDRYIVPITISYYSEIFN